MSQTLKPPRPRGRPPAPEGRSLLTMRLSATKHDQLIRFASTRGLSVSQVVRAAIERTLVKPAR